MDAATEAKTAVEESQREARRKMDEHGEVHVPRFFHLKDGRWVPKLSYVFTVLRACSLADVIPLLQAALGPP